MTVEQATCMSKHIKRMILAKLSPLNSSEKRSSLKLVKAEANDNLTTDYKYSLSVRP